MKFYLFNCLDGFIEVLDPTDGGEELLCLFRGQRTINVGFCFLPREAEESFEGSLLSVEVFS